MSAIVRSPTARKPPGPKGHWLLGSLREFQQDMLAFYTQIARECGDVVAFRLGPKKLVLLNDPTYVEASRKLAERLLREAQSDAERIRLAFRLTAGRLPTASEQQVLAKMQTKAFEAFDLDRPRAEKLLSVGESPRDSELDAAAVASWTVVGQALLNLDEVVSRN